MITPCFLLADKIPESNTIGNIFFSPKWIFTIRVYCPPTSII